jgi:hypothetical protein
MMTDRKQWKKIEAVVRAVIHEWDPYALVGGGAPEDEWDSEILKIVSRVRNIKTPAEATAAISDVFSVAFQPKGFTREDCTQVGQQLFDALTEAGLI